MSISQQVRYIYWAELELLNVASREQKWQRLGPTYDQMHLAEEHVEFRVGLVSNKFRSVSQTLFLKCVPKHLLVYIGSCSEPMGVLSWGITAVFELPKLKPGQRRLVLSSPNEEASSVMVMMVMMVISDNA